MVVTIEAINPIFTLSEILRMSFYQFSVKTILFKIKSF